jgi:4-amino-4-deoxy-L-arabinose transferase-like glycosyltransferase
VNKLALIVTQHKAIAVILVAFVLLSTTYSVVTPIFEAPDELQHYFFVQHLAERGRLPVITGPVPDIQAEVHQPPLYYALGALVTFWIDTNPLTDFFWRNPHAQIGVPTASGNVNMVVHSAEESFPYRGVTLAVHLVRWLSVLMGAATVLTTYCLARQIMPQRPHPGPPPAPRLSLRPCPSTSLRTSSGQAVGERTKALAIGAAVINAFNPQFAFISGTINNDNLMTFLFALAVLLLVVLVKRTETSKVCKTEVPVGRLISLGVVIGLASLTKLTGLMLLPLAAVVLGVVALRRRKWIPFVGWMAIVTIVALIVGGWWYARNWLLYGDPLGMRIMSILFRTRVYRPSLLELLAEFKGLRMSFWALFGWFNILAEPWLYLAFDGLALMGAVGLLLLVFRQSRETDLCPHSNMEETPSWPWLLFLLLWIAVVLAGLVRWTQMTHASQGRLMYPAIPAISILLFTGLSQWVPKRAVTPLAGVLGVTMLAIAVVSPFRYIAPAYAKPPLLSETELEKIPNPMAVTFNDQIKLLGYEASREAVRPGESFEITLYWQALAPMERNYSVFVHLLDENDLVLASQDTFPGQGTYPTRLWQAGDAIADVYTIAVPPTAFTPSSAQFEVGLYEFESGKRLAVYGPQGEPLGDNVRFHRIEVLPHEESDIPNPVRFNFGNQIALIGYTMEGRAVGPGDEIHLTLYWAALAEMEQDYTVFTHIIGERDRIWAQVDSQPQKGAAPTSIWSRGQVLMDEYHLLLEPDTPPGVYDIEVGLYLAATGERLGLLDEAGHWIDSRVLLTKVRVR